VNLVIEVIISANGVGWPFHTCIIRSLGRLPKGLHFSLEVRSETHTANGVG